MPTYRCFCTTADDRIITGAQITADSLPSAVEAANQLWQTEPEFRLVEVWLERDRLCPSDAGPNVACWINQISGYSMPASCQRRQASGQCRFGAVVGTPRHSGIRRDPPAFRERTADAQHANGRQ
jgi:hypothetical protein